MYPALGSPRENERWAIASHRLIKAFAHAGGRRAVIAGSCAEYEYDPQRPLSETATPLTPSSAYGSWKNQLHESAQEVADTRDVDLVWGRVFSVYGPGERVERLVPSIAISLIEGRPALCSSGHQRRDFLYTLDAALAFTTLLDGDFTGAVNIASGEATTVREVVSLIAEEVGRPELRPFWGIAVRRDRSASSRGRHESAHERGRVQTEDLASRRDI